MGFVNCRCYYSGNLYPTKYIDLPITRWDEGNYDCVIETFLDSGNRNTLFAHVTPGAVSDLMEGSPLGLHYFIDTTFSKSANTLIFEPMSDYALSSIRETRMVAVKNISDTFLTNKLFTIKMEAIRLGKFGF